MKLEELRAIIDSNNIESIDIKYSDLVGNWYHLGIPVTRLEWLLENGVPFDSSSVPGMRSVESGDMLLFPDLSTAIIDPFTRNPTLRMLSDICDAQTRTGWVPGPFYSFRRETPSRIRH